MTQELPIELEVFLINHGFFQLEDMPEFIPYRFKHRTEPVMVVSTTPERRRPTAHTPVYVKEKYVGQHTYVAWKPSFEGEEPPF